MPRKQLDPESGIIRAFMQLPTDAAGKLLDHLSAMHEGRLRAGSQVQTAAAPVKTATRKPTARKPTAAKPVAAAPATFAPENPAGQPVGPRRRAPIPAVPGDLTKPAESAE